MINVFIVADHAYQAYTLRSAPTFAQHWAKLELMAVFLYRAQLMAGRHHIAVISCYHSLVNDFSGYD
jgi:hypothetical protein